MFFEYITLISARNLRCVSEVLQALNVGFEDSERKREETAAAFVA
jgi:hypothetical protein